MNFGRTPVKHVGVNPFNPPELNVWPATLPPVRQVLQDDLALGKATVFVGENGAGKSTLVEAIALAYGLNPEGGSTGAIHQSRSTESELHSYLQLARNAGTSKYGYFLRAETMHGFFNYLEDNPSARRRDIDFHKMSHGESFTSLITDRFKGGGLWVLDDGDSQVILSTHSPVLAALTGADIYEVGDWRSFLDVPERFLKHL